MKTNNRLFREQADYLLIILRKPSDWKPESLKAIPPTGEVMSVDHVASFEEACDDLFRCNGLASTRSLDRWAIVLSGGGDL